MNMAVLVFPACLKADREHIKTSIFFLFKYFNGEFYILGEWLYHLYKLHLNWFTYNREPDSFTFTF